MSSYFRSLYQAYSKISPAALALVLSQPNNMRVFQAALFAAFACAVSASGFIGFRPVVTENGFTKLVDMVHGLIAKDMGALTIPSESGGVSLLQCTWYRLPVTAWIACQLGNSLAIFALH